MDKLDIRILALYKQHYLNKYRGDLGESDYSCLGYYDGLSILPTSEARSKLFKKVSNSPISPIWYGMGDSIYKLDGECSKQNIGIFRIVNDSNDFWEGMYKNSPYFAVGFIRLDNLVNYADVADIIEKKGEACIKENDGSIVKRYVQNIVYHTFDNAHLVVFVKSNSMIELGAMLQEIRETVHVKYMHSIVGISCDYLKKCGEDQVLPCYESINCHIDDILPCITHKIVTSGNLETINNILYLLQKQSINPNLGLKNYNEATYSFVTGHENLMINIPGTDVKSLLAMFIQYGFSTHNNGIYGDEIYNIETDIIFKKEKLFELREGVVLEDMRNRELSWCKAMIAKCKKEMKKALEEGDESLYSCYRALIQTLNTLVQYEGFSLSKDIFYLLFPSFAMFYEHLEQVNSEENKKPKTVLKNALCEFITAINSIIYHTVHTDQIFLMVPGYTGTSYSIPIKNCLLYLGVAEQVIQLLNDKADKYKCLLTPEMEAHPSTTLINIGASDTDRLIQFHASQRSLYIPRHFLIILTHEIAHYVGAKIRAREKRRKCLISTIACLIAEAILPEVVPENVNKELYEKYLSETKELIKTKCEEYLTDELDKSANDRKDHAIELEKILVGKCQDFLVNETDGIGYCIYMIPESIMANKQLQDDSMKVSREINSIQSIMKYYRNMLLASSTMQTLIANLMSMYKEIFSDVAANSILKCTYETFEEAFDVSEGVKIEEQMEDPTHSVRKMMIGILFEGHYNPFIGGNINKNSQVNQNSQLDKEWPNSILNSIYDYVGVGVGLYEYAEQCKVNIEKRIQEKVGLQDIRQKIRDTYTLFGEDSKNCSEIYKEIIQRINEYTCTVEAEYQRIKKETDF